MDAVRLQHWLGRSLLLWGLVMALVLFMLPILLVVGLSSEPMEGPFMGTPRQENPSRQPDQVFVLAGGRQLESYDPLDSDPAPTLLLRGAGSSVMWCVFATASSAVRTLRFHEAELESNGQTTVTGLVDWTMGREAAKLSMTSDGKLTGYWFSW